MLPGIGLGSHQEPLQTHNMVLKGVVIYVGLWAPPHPCKPHLSNPIHST